MAAFERAAQTYWWSQVPPCGAPQWTVAEVPDTEAGDANPASCLVRISRTDWDAQMSGNPFVASGLCRTFVHEYGHLVLGPSYFASSNPTDPGHSPDPHSVMFAEVTAASIPACDALQRVRRVGVWVRRHGRSRRVVRERLRTNVAGVLVSDMPY
jgi:hypothetical protein